VENLNFIVNCLITFGGVFVVLFVLSLCIRALIEIFPEKPSGSDHSIIAAITNHFRRAYPQSGITKIEEKK